MTEDQLEYAFMLAISVVFTLYAYDRIKLDLKVPPWTRPLFRKLGPLAIIADTALLISTFVR
jgi:hypothetical protein